MKSGNRFIGAILDGSIGSIAELKAAYRSEAKEAHPDLSDSGGHDAFLKLRTEYEHALRELSRGMSGAAPADAFERTPGAAPEGDPLDALEALLKRGFPKAPRHRKEALRYGYARLRARGALAALGEDLPALFDAMEKELLGENGRDAAETVVRLLSAFIKAERSSDAASGAAVRMERGRLFPPIPLGGGAAAIGPGSTRARPGGASEAFCRRLFSAERTERGSR